MNLQEEGILVAFSVTMRGVTARSRIISREAAETHEAQEDRLRGIVHKLSSSDLAPLVKIVNAARALFLANTLPWDKDYHLIPVQRFAHLQREISRMINDFNDEVEKLLSRYPQLKREYLKEVNDLAQEVPFPTLEQMQGNFNMKLTVNQIANPNDFRLKHVDPKTVESLRAQITAATAERMEEAHKDIINRLYKIVARVHEATSKEDGRLFETLKTNMEEAVEVLPKLNMKNDPEITRLITRVRTELTSIDIETLRVDKKERAKTSKLAGSILNDLRSYAKQPTKKATTVVAQPHAAVAPINAALKAAEAKKSGRSAFARVRI